MTLIALLAYAGARLVAALREACPPCVAGSLVQSPFAAPTVGCRELGTLRVTCASRTFLPRPPHAGKEDYG